MTEPVRFSDLWEKRVYDQAYFTDLIVPSDDADPVRKELLELLKEQHSNFSDKKIQYTFTNPKPNDFDPLYMKGVARWDYYPDGFEGDKIIWS